MLILLDELERFTELAPELVGSPVIWMLPLALLRVIVPLENAPPVIVLLSQVATRDSEVDGEKGPEAPKRFT